MATIKSVILKHHKKEDGTWNVKIRVTHARTSAYIPTGFYVGPKQLNKKLEITDNFLRVEIDTLVTEIRRIIVAMRGREINLSARQLAEAIEKELNAGKDFVLCFIKYGRGVADEKKASGSVSTGKIYVSLLNRLELFTGGPKLPISEITPKFLSHFETHLESQGLTNTGINLYMRTLRAIFNSARKEYNDEDLGQIKIPSYPFLKYQIPPADDSKKRALKIATLKAIRDSEPTNKREILARDVFMLSFYLVGMNTIDLFNCTEIREGRIIYQRTKTRSRRRDKAEISIRIEPEAKALVEKYRDPSGNRVFNFYLSYADRSTFNANVNKGLKKVGDLEEVNVKGLNTYYARHSWATIARNICRISKDDVALCLNHASQDHKVTDIYIEDDFSIIDESNRKVLDQLSTYRIKIEITSLSHLSTN